MKRKLAQRELYGSNGVNYIARHVRRRANYQFSVAKIAVMFLARLKHLIEPFMWLRANLIYDTNLIDD